MSSFYKGLEGTDFQLPGQEHLYKGKVRDVYTLKDDLLVMVASDRISAFDHILPRAIPYKGEMLNTIATKFLEATKDIVPNWLQASPHPAVAIGLKCEPIKIEMVIRGYLVGHAWRLYKAGQRSICGVEMPEGMVENQAFEKPIITPATKADEGHDEDISREEILARNIVPESIYVQLEQYTRQLFERGAKMAAERGLILVDTKYEFGLYKGEIILMDEVHTPDSSRYFYADKYEECLAKGERQKHLSKEFVREWLMARGFQGLDGQQMPAMNDDDVLEIQARYLELYQLIMGDGFKMPSRTNNLAEMEASIVNFLAQH